MTVLGEFIIVNWVTCLNIAWLLRLGLLADRKSSDHWLFGWPAYAAAPIISTIMLLWAGWYWGWP